MNTTVINLFGGSGLGKSTTAAALFAEMKVKGYQVELVREYVKNWAWEGKKVGPFDQIYLLGKQIKAESSLYGKVEYLVTDSPVLLSPVYDKFYNKTITVEQAALGFLKIAEERGVKYKNFYLTRNKPFDSRGRFETEEQAKQVDLAVKTFLDQNNINYKVIESNDRDRIEAILGEL